MKKRFLTLVSVVMLCGSQPSAAHNFWQFKWATAGATNANNAVAVAIPGLLFDTQANVTFTFRCYIASHTATNATTGIQYSLTGPANPATVLLMVETPGNAAGSTWVQHYYGTGAAGYTGFLGNASDSLTTFHIDRITGEVNNTVAGTVQILFQPEVAETATIGSGSWCELETPRPTNTYSPQG